MKAFKILAFTVLMAFAFVGCTKVEKILVKQDGKWKVTNSVVRTYMNNQLTQTTVIANGFDEIYTFEKDGIGSATSGSISIAFTWSINADQDEIVVCYENQGASVCNPSTIIESEKDKQVWTSTNKAPNNPDWVESDNTYERVK